MALVRRSARRPAMPDAFDRAPLRSVCRWRSPFARELADSFRETCRILPRRIRARIQSHQSKCRSSGSPSLGHPDLPLRLDPVDDQLRKGVAVALQHQHVAVAGDTEVAEVDEVGFSSVRVEPIDDRFVYRTRLTEAVCTGEDQQHLPATL